MDDSKHPFGIQEIMEPLQQIGSSSTWVLNQEGNKPIKNSQSRIEFTIRKRINGCCREEQTHFQENDTELKGYHRKRKIHLTSPLMADNQKRTKNAGYESDVHGSNVKINSERATCMVCGKIFSSLRSLFGHMRWHPKWQWRGIKPPLASTPKTISSITGSVTTMGMIDNQQKDSPSTFGRSDFVLLQFLKGWSVTGKRGRLSSDEREAIEGLSMLANGNSMDLAKRNNIDRTRVAEGSLMAEIENPEQDLESSELRKKRKIEGLETGNMEFQCKRPKFDKEIENPRDGVKPGFVRLDSGLEILDGFQEFLGENRVVDQLDNAYTLYRIPSRNYISYKSEFIKKLYELGMRNYMDTPISSDRFNCTSSKSFASYQALGGHKSSNMNCKNSIQKAYAEEFSLVDIAVRNLTQVDELQEFNASMLKKKIGNHQCKICDKAFSTGPALGGHQREHWSRPFGAPISSVPLLGEGITMDRKLVRINLSEPRLGMVNVFS